MASRPHAPSGASTASAVGRRSEILTSVLQQGSPSVGSNGIGPRMSQLSAVGVKRYSTSTNLPVESVLKSSVVSSRFGRTLTLTGDPTARSKNIWQGASQALGIREYEGDSDDEGVANKYQICPPQLTDAELGFDYDKWKKQVFGHRFPRPALEELFWQFYLDAHVNKVKFSLLFYAFVLAIFGLVTVYETDDNEKFVQGITLRGVCVGLIVVFLILFQIGIWKHGELQEYLLLKSNKKQYSGFLAEEDSSSDEDDAPDLNCLSKIGLFVYNNQAQAVFLIGVMIGGLAIGMSYTGGHPDHGPYWIGFFGAHLLLGMGSKLSSLLCWMIAVAYTLFINLVKEESDHDTHVTGTSLYMLGCVVLLTAMGEYLEFSYRKLYYKKSLLKLETYKSDMLLYNLVPARVALQLKRNEREAVTFPYCAPHWGASVFFCQISDFEELTTNLQAAELVNYLNKVFRYLDFLCVKNDVYKVETVGEVYMAACGLPNPVKDHQSAVSDFALDIKEMLIDGGQKETERGRGASVLAIDGRTDLEVPTLKIGLNCGTVIAGVIGKLCPRYRLFGDTVNVAARMETNSERGKIHMTDLFHGHLPNRFICEDRGLIKIKGKNVMHTWWLKGRQDGPAKRASNLAKPMNLGGVDSQGLGGATSNETYYTLSQMMGSPKQTQNFAFPEDELNNLPIMDFLVSNSQLNPGASTLFTSKRAFQTARLAGGAQHPAGLRVPKGSHKRVATADSSGNSGVPNPYVDRDCGPLRARALSLPVSQGERRSSNSKDDRLPDPPEEVKTGESIVGPDLGSDGETPISPALLEGAKKSTSLPRTSFIKDAAALSGSER